MSLIPRTIRAKLSTISMASAIAILMLYIISHRHTDNTKMHVEHLHTTHDNRLQVDEKYVNHFVAEGHIFNDKGVVRHLTNNMTTSVVHSFSPYTEERFKSMILEPRNEQRIYANSPACMFHEESILCVLRVWLQHELYHEKKAPKPLNDLADNYLYIQKFDWKMSPTTPGSILGIPTPRQWVVGDGPIEPRLFKTDDKNVFISYNTGVYLPNDRALDSTFIWDYYRHKTILPEIKGGSPIVKNVQEGRMPRDKHWTAYMDHGRLRMVYNLDPLRIMECTTNFSCEFVHFEGPDDYSFHQNRDSLRGGTMWKLYKYPYYYSIGHSTLFKRPNYDRIYTINLIVLKVSPYPRIVYVGGPIQIHRSAMNAVPIVRHDYIQDPFFFPVSMLVEDEDTLTIGGHINDFSAVLVRLKGVQQVLDDVITEVSKQSEDMKGPPLSYLHVSAKTLATSVHHIDFFTEEDDP